MFRGDGVGRADVFPTNTATGSTSVTFTPPVTGKQAGKAFGSRQPSLRCCL